MYCIIISEYRVAQNRTKFVHVALAGDYGYYSRSIEKRIAIDGERGGRNEKETKKKKEKSKAGYKILGR